jgi:hypothetical protein
MRRLLPLLVLLASIGSAATPSPLLGIWGKHPWDSDVTHALLDTLPYTYTYINLDYDYWTNGTPFLEDGPDFYDEFYNLNLNSTQIWGIYGVPTNAIASFVPQILARYPLIAAVIPINEETNYSIANSTTLLFRAAVTNKPLLGPAWLNDYSISYMTNTMVSLTNYDGLIMHDYSHVPGQGVVSYPPWQETDYYHPDQNPPGWTNFTARIQWMRSFTNYLRTNYPTWPKVMLTEWAIYVSNTTDAVKSGRIVYDMQLPVIFNSPNGPAGRTNSLSYNQAYYNSNASAAVWSEAMQEFVKQVTPTKTYRTLRIGR